MEVDGAPERARLRDAAARRAWTSGRRTRGRRCGCDLLSLTDRFDRFLPVGFYYKTFIRPRRLWPLYERVLRAARRAWAGSTSPDAPDAPRAEAPRARRRRGDRRRPGGLPRGARGRRGRRAASCSSTTQPRAGRPPADRGRARSTGRRPARGPARARGGRRGSRRWSPPSRGIEHLAPTRPPSASTRAGWSACTRATALRPRPRARRSSSRPAPQERPDAVRRENDRAGRDARVGRPAARAWLHGVLAGERAVVVTDDDHGWRAGRRAARTRASRSRRWSTAGRRRAGDAASRPEAARAAAWRRVLRGARPRPRDRAAARVERAARVRARTAPSATIDCDLVAMAVRPEPVVALLAQARRAARAGTSALGEFVPGDPCRTASARGRATCCGVDGRRARRARRRRSRAGQRPSRRGGGRRCGRRSTASADQLVAHDRAMAARSRRARRRRRSSSPAGGKQFVCLCEDVTVKELEQGVDEGFDDPRDAQALQHRHHGPLPGQDVPRPRGAAPRAARRRRRPPTTGLTTARPPFQPVPLAVARRPAPRARSGAPRCTSGTTRWARRGSTWATGSGRSTTATSTAEVAAVREAAGLIDVSTLGQARRPGPGRRRVPRLAAPEPLQRPARSGACATGRCSTTRASSSTTARSPGSARSGSSSRPRPATSTRSSSGSAGGSPGATATRRGHERHRPVRRGQPRRAAGARDPGARHRRWTSRRPALPYLAAARGTRRRGSRP